jgi:allantoin racemase
MKILVINPNTTESMTGEIGASARRCAQPGTVVDTVTAEWGPRSIECHFEEVLAAAATTLLVARHQNEYDAFVIACYGDPGLYAAKEVTDRPVIGIGEASILLACMLAHKFSVVTVIDRIVPMLEDMIGRYGLSRRCVSVRSSGLTVLEIEEDPTRAAREIVRAARLAIEHDGAEAITLGCAGMGLVERTVAQELSDVPVIDGVVAAVKAAEALVGAGLVTSKVRAFAVPEPKEIVGFDASTRGSDAGSGRRHRGSVSLDPADQKSKFRLTGLGESCEH